MLKYNQLVSTHLLVRLCRNVGGIARYAEQVASSAVKIQDANKLHKEILPTLKFSLEDREVIKEDIVGVEGAFLLHNVLSEEECSAFINETERLGYKEAPVTLGPNSFKMLEDVRNNTRVMWEANEETLNAISKRIAKYLPQHALPGWTVGSGKDSLNERFRFYKYAPREYFVPHFDGCFRRNEECCSYLTFIIYLNGGLEGGETTFLINNERIKVDPTPGTALLFYHRGNRSPRHEGTPHRSEGKFKYALRSDIMYFRREN